MNTLKVRTIREFTHQLAKIMKEGGEVVLVHGNEPYRYMNIRPIVISRDNRINSEDYVERLKEANSLQKEISISSEKIRTAKWNK